jgi:hypothetical protein
VRRRQAELGVAARAAGERLVGGAAQAMLPAPGGEREARRRAHRGIGVAVGEAHALPRHAVEHRRAVRPSAIAAEVGVAEVVGQDKDEVRARSHAMENSS